MLIIVVVRALTQAPKIGERQVKGDYSKKKQKLF